MYAESRYSTSVIFNIQIEYIKKETDLSLLFFINMMMKYAVSKNSIHIEDSYLISKNEFGNELKKIEDLYAGETSVFKYRTYESLEKEWAVHNLCYNLHLFRSHTKDVDLNYPQIWYESCLYNIFGGISLLLIP